MSLLSYQLQIKRYQKELKIDSRTFNALDVKHSDINLLKQLQLLNPIVPAPAPPAPPQEENWSGAITFVNNSGTGGSQQFISIKKSTGSILVTDYIYNSSNNVLSASTNSDFYLDINIYSSGDWNWLDGGFTEAVGGYTNIFEANKGWRRYTIPSQFIGQNLTYNFSFYDND